jgi:CRISPR-associated protein Cmr1
MAEIAYGAFPLQPSAEAMRSRNEPRVGELHKLRNDVELTLRFRKTIISEQTGGLIDVAREVQEAIDAWFILGGVGGRTRRGFGALASHCSTTDPIQWLKDREIIFKHTPPTYTDPIQALSFGIGKLQRFRQGQGVGRNHGAGARAGRSRWPEAELIRFRTEKSDPQHEGRLVSVDKVPRASFGLPIIFHFQSPADPGDCQLKPVGHERFASPLIIRPYRASHGKFGCLAVILGQEHIPNDVELVDQVNGEGPWQESRRLTSAEASRYKSPLRGEPDPLRAFLDFFERPKNTENIP